MNAAANTLSLIVTRAGMAERVAAIDWELVSRDLDAQSSAMIEHLLSPPECETLASLYSQD